MYILWRWNSDRKRVREKIVVIGSPGAGKSTFSRKLRDVTGLPLYYLDMLYHKPDRTTVSRQEFDAKLKDMPEGVTAEHI